MEPRTKEIIVNVSIIAVVIVLCIVGYFLFVKNDAIKAALSGSDTAVIDETVAAGADVTKTVAQIAELNKAVEDTNKLLSSSTFTDLRDFSVTVPKEAIGRANPFVSTEWKLKALAREKAAGKK
ncbi:MAG: hypothetical protein UY07_C0012G0007 [Parcubacteria group bacterium GW2011_GWA1_47_8]|nr:MAG: hypothetical protein UY07_C0012G0007 [Parcubacteria group bacterium GW2011_GWA1_47_8]KKW07751.1 MAG: hypothetical protein UY42_C0007G0018 [Parcubacteria group bacterium GW2011_GWA2_49_16]